MKTRDYFLQAAVTACVAFVVAAGVSYLYRLIVHGQAAVNWETALDLAIVLGVVLPLVSARGSAVREKN